jgi:ubiquinone/menaquinone biosynthesis C-methylase UbiE
MEFLLAGDKLQRCRTAFLDEVAGARNILILGEGNGRFLAACRRALPNANVTCVDSSNRMLAIARKRLEQSGGDPERIEFVTTDALAWPAPPNSFDLIVTHFFLDCFQTGELKILIASLARAATGRAVWLLADFQVPASGFGRYRAAAIHRAMYLFFRLATGLSARSLANPDRFLRAHNFNLRERRVSDWGLLRTDCWVRGSGAG